ncbi:MAG: signal recognition particle-docking protein FtsY [Candidatus Anstonellales archaeon]
MFGFLKEKIGGFIQKIVGKKKEEKVKEEKKKEKKEEKKAEKKEERKERAEAKPKEKPKTKPERKEKPLVEKKEIKKEIREEKKEKKIEEKKIEVPEFREERKPKVKVGLLKTITSMLSGKVRIDESDISDALEDFELYLIEGDVAIEVAEEIKNEFKKKVVGSEVKDAEGFLKSAFEKTLVDIMEGPDVDVVKLAKAKKEKPFKIMFFGPNGAGKTTTIAKVANLFLKNKLSVVLSASDTFRAAAIEQLEEHGRRLGVPVIKSSYGADPTAVAYDAVEHAKAKGIDVVLIDTAGRQETSSNLMREIEKMVRVIKPDLKIYIGESIAGHALLEQVKEFHERVGMDGVILTKIDVDPKGGTILSVRKATSVPVIYVGTGQNYDDLEKFDAREIAKKIVEG